MENTKAKFHILNVNALVSEFQAGLVDEELKLKYVLAGSILLSLYISVLTMMPSQGGITVWFIDPVISLLAVIIGTTLAFKKNKEGDNMDFVARFTCISFVVTMIVTVCVFLLFLILGVVAGVLELSAMDAFIGHAYFNTFSMIVTWVIMYALIIKYIGQVSKAVNN